MEIVLQTCGVARGGQHSYRTASALLMLRDAKRQQETDYDRSRERQIVRRAALQRALWEAQKQLLRKRP